MSKPTFRFIKFRIYPEEHQLANLPLDQVIVRQRFAVKVENDRVRLLEVAAPDSAYAADMSPYKARGKVPTKLANQALQTDKLKITQNKKGFYASVLCRIPPVI